MKVNVLDVREQPRELDFELSPRDLALDDVKDIEFIAPVVGHLKLSAVGESILVSGRLETQVKLVCVRCLEQFKAPLDCPKVQLRFIPGPVKADDEDEVIEVHLDEEEVKHFDGNEIDMTEELRELLLLNAPSYPHCSAACQPLGKQQPPEDEAKTDGPLPEWKAKLKNVKLD